MENYKEIARRIKKEGFLGDFRVKITKEIREESVRRLKNLNREDYINVVKKFLENFNSENYEKNFECFYSINGIILSKRILFKFTGEETLVNLTLHNCFYKDGEDILTGDIKIYSSSSSRYGYKIHIQEIRRPVKYIREFEYIKEKSLTLFDNIKKFFNKK